MKRTLLPLLLISFSTTYGMFKQACARVTSPTNRQSQNLVARTMSSYSRRAASRKKCSTLKLATTFFSGAFTGYQLGASKKSKTED